jgi:hypothetical protein
MRAAVIATLVLGAAAQGSVNKIVGMLQGMQKTVQEEGANSAKLWEEASTQYRTDKQATEYAIGDSSDALDAAKACVADSAAKAQQAESDIADLAAKLAKNAADLDEATKIRNKERADFEKTEQELSDTIDTLVRAASVIRRATGGSGSAGTSAKLKKAFAQVAASLSTVMDAAFINLASRKKLAALLQAGQKTETDEEDYVEPTKAAYTEHSTNIVDLLVDLKQQAEAEMSELRKDESNRQHAYDMLAQSLRDSTKVAEGDKSNAEHSLHTETETNAKCAGKRDEQSKIKSESEDYLANLVADYKVATEEHNARTTDREGELTALAKAIEILSGASGAFKRRDVLIQTRDEPDVRQELAQVLKAAAGRLHSVELAQLAVQAQEDQFGKIKGLIKDMIARLQKQAAEEADHKAWCDTEKRKNEAKRDDRSGKLENYSTRLEQSNAEAAQLKQDIAKLSDEIAQSDNAMAAATKLRNEENAAYNSLMEDCRTGLEALSQAISVLKDYYGSAKAHAEKSDGGNNVIAFLEVAQTDMIKMKTEGQETEQNAAAAYEKMKNEQEQIRASKSSSVKGKEQEGARLAALISDLQNDVDGTQGELDDTLAYLQKLKGSCVHKVESFEERAAKMQKEIESLHEALDILENESAGFLQIRRH